MVGVAVGDTKPTHLLLGRAAYWRAITARSRAMQPTRSTTAPHKAACDGPTHVGMG